MLDTDARVELKTRVATPPSSPREQDRGRFLLGSAERKRERGRGGSVHPLDVIDRNKKRPLAHERPQDCEHGNRHSTRINRNTACLLEQQRTCERVAQRRRKPPNLSVGVREQVAQRRERQLALRLCRPSNKPAKPVLPRPFDAR